METAHTGTYTMRDQGTGEEEEVKDRSERTEAERDKQRENLGSLPRAAAAAAVQQALHRLSFNLQIAWT